MADIEQNLLYQILTCDQLTASKKTGLIDDRLARHPGAAQEFDAVSAHLKAERERSGEELKKSAQDFVSLQAVFADISKGLQEFEKVSQPCLAFIEGLLEKRQAEQEAAVAPPFIFDVALDHPVTVRRKPFSLKSSARMLFC